MTEAIIKLRRIARIQTRAAANAIAKRAPERPRTTPYGPYAFRFPSRSSIGRAVAEGITWDGQLPGIVAALPAGALVCEVGSNIGASLLTMAAARDDLRFVCFEPSERFLPYLRENVERNGLAGRVTIEPDLVGPPDEQFELTSSDSTASVVTGPYHAHIPRQRGAVTSIGLDDYFSGRGEWPAFVKIDTDGFEAKVLGSAKRLLAQHLPTLFVEYTPGLLSELGDSSEALRALLVEAGYGGADVYSAEGELLECDHPLDVPISTENYVDLVLHGRSGR